MDNELAGLLITASQFDHLAAAKVIQTRFRAHDETAHGKSVEPTPVEVMIVEDVRSASHSVLKDDHYCLRLTAQVAEAVAAGPAELQNLLANMAAFPEMRERAEKIEAAFIHATTGIGRRVREIFLGYRGGPGIPYEFVGAILRLSDNHLQQFIKEVRGRARRFKHPERELSTSESK